MMNSSKRTLLSIVCSIFTFSIMVVPLIRSEALQQDEKPFFFSRPHVNVTIQNNNDYILGVHCKSGDKDIGFRSLKKGERYEWHFRVNLMNTTLFFCGFSQENINKGVFNIYESIRDTDR
ncbi:hypothetical protein EUTSA_v10015541mg [Eutrema salsugineum]|uniref:S-protein homolog n=1 Tax=Eutrema salsugineum TaxID=72664 RepID=V4N503_EUTSA|nr:S-protein homolog 28 [Eutrema salsugineum]ESQ40496.1 hypothetical protein EUTSA_v10015541mg [Eutrema salsugineum]